MNIVDFKRIITSFADKPTDLAFEKGQLLTEIRGELIHAKISSTDGVLYVEENGETYAATNWIRNRIAGLPQLADRILDYIPADKFFVNPSGKLLDELEFDPQEQEQPVVHTLDKLVEILSRKIPGTTSIVYLTSDAGEGKTTLINQLAHIQAKNFAEKKSDWLLLPVPLGGRPFLRFDDIVVASIVNNLRFRYFYYDSFIELVRLGFIVPAFDGFEEMFMQSSTGEALSATGGLINKLNSSGSILIAARKAYFDYKSFSSQAKLLDSINSSVSFARFSIDRWNKEQFIEYTKKKGILNGEEIYDLVSYKLNNPFHPILTRPVLVKQLMEVFKDFTNVSELVSKLQSVSDYFPIFVNAIIEREANFKWIDTSGEPFQPILTVAQHYELLSILAEEMWVNSSDNLKDTVLDLLSEMFAEQSGFDIQTIRQVKERIRQHALIVRVDPNNPTYKFDHQEFFEFFLGIAIANNLMQNKLIEIKSYLKKAPLPFQTSESAVARIKSMIQDFQSMIRNLDVVIKGENQFSYTKENVGNIVIRILSYEKVPLTMIKGYELPVNALLTIRLENIVFEDCHFQNTSLISSTFINCAFTRCLFDRLEFHESTYFSNVVFTECEVSTAYDNIKEKGFYDQHSIDLYLQMKGAHIKREESISDQVITVQDSSLDDLDLELTEKILRRFIRSNTPINDSIFKMRLGNNANYFLKNILPDLLKYGILVEVEYFGQGQKRRFKLGKSFGQIEAALEASKGVYQKFLNYF